MKRFATSRPGYSHMWLSVIVPDCPACSPAIQILTSSVEHTRPTLVPSPQRPDVVLQLQMTVAFRGFLAAVRRSRAAVRRKENWKNCNTSKVQVTYICLLGTSRCSFSPFRSAALQRSWPSLGAVSGMSGTRLWNFEADPVDASCNTADVPEYGHHVPREVLTGLVHHKTVYVR